MQTGQAGSADDLEKASNLEEGAPLLPKDEMSPESPPTESGTASRKEAVMAAATSVMNLASAATHSNQMMKTSSKNNKLLSYDHDSLLTASSLTLIAHSVFGQKPVLYTLAYCCFLAGCSAVCVFYIPKASKLDTQKFEEFAGFLKFFITFMLGIYVQQAFKRWWVTVTTFEKILIGIRQMVFMLHTLRSTASARKLIESYCIASSYLLNVEVRNAQIIEKRHHSEIEGVYTWLVEQNLLTQEDVEQLGTGPSGLLSKTRAVWSWIGELVSHPEVEEGVNVLAPLLTRSIMMCQSCISDIEHLKMNITMQTPFMYAQLLAILVHVNNAILAISCGMSVGSSMNEIRRRSEQLLGERDTARRDITVTEQLYGAFQTLGLQLVIVLLTPMLYIGFLHIAHILCYPFGDQSYHLPTETLIKRLHSELHHMSVNRAYFRAKRGDVPQEWLQQLTGKTDKKGKQDECDDDDDD